MEVGDSDSAYRWELGMECLSWRGASYWGQKNICWTVIGWLEVQWGQIIGYRLVKGTNAWGGYGQCEVGKRTTSVRGWRVLCWEDDHGSGKLSSWASLLLARIWFCQRAVQCCLIKWRMVRAMSAVQRGDEREMRQRPVADFAAASTSVFLSMPSWLGTRWKETV